MKTPFFLLIFVAYFNVVESINCVSAENGVIKDGNSTCLSTDTLCATVILKYIDPPSGLVYINKRQGCGNVTTWTINGIQNKCNKAENLTLEDDLGSVSCCDKNLCNNDTPLYVHSSATTN